MASSLSTRKRSDIDVRTVCGPELMRRLSTMESEQAAADHPEHDLRWLAVLSESMQHEPLLIEALRADGCVGHLPLALVSGRLFGRFLVSLPYLSSSGVQAADAEVAGQLIDRAAELAVRYDCRFLELRQERTIDHPKLDSSMTSKVHMRLGLPGSSTELWDSLNAKVRNQVRKGHKNQLQVEWGGQEWLDAFYEVFSRNMRDLGTPVYGRRLFQKILQWFPDQAEFCIVKHGKQPVAAALLVHGRLISEVPSASSLRQYNGLNANMLMYWSLLERCVQRGQQVFDFGRSTIDSSTFRFKKQWGALSSPAVWQYYLRKGSSDQLRPDSSRNQRLIRIWQRLPVPLTRWLGPVVVRGIP